MAPTIRHTFQGDAKTNRGVTSMPSARETGRKQRDPGFHRGPCHVPEKTGTRFAPCGAPTIFQQFGSNDVFIDGNSNRWIGATNSVQNVALYGGTRNDTFAVEQMKSGAALSIYGGDGNDSCAIGSADMQANLTSASAFTFDGQVGSDTFIINNSGNGNAWTYRMQGTSVADSTPTISPTYSWTSGTTSIERVRVNAGAGADVCVDDGIGDGFDRVGFLRLRPAGGDALDGECLVIDRGGNVLAGGEPAQRPLHPPHVLVDGLAGPAQPDHLFL
jgi:hypothetical protein